MKNYTVALAGNPNVGKSTIFNNLTGMHQHTGNWTGKTVGNSQGKSIINNEEFIFVDIPGTYSIMSSSEEEEIARDYICFGNPDVTVVVVDSTILERNLNLVFQIMEITDNIIVCVNLLDEAKKKKIKINLKKLEALLGVPVVGTTARNKKTLENLKNIIYKTCKGNIKINPNKIKYSDFIKEDIDKLSEKIFKINGYNISKKLSDWIAIKLIDGEEKILDSIKDNMEINLESEEITKELKKVKENLQKKRN